MPDETEAVETIDQAWAWDERVSLIRRIPQDFGIAVQARIYAAVAGRVYVPHLSPDFLHVHWREECELDAFAIAYNLVVKGTEFFEQVDVDTLADLMERYPETVRVFRTITGFTAQEFASLAGMVGDSKSISGSRIKSMEAGRPVKPEDARSCAKVVDRVMSGEAFAAPAEGVRRKLDKPDTKEGWKGVRAAARDGVPYEVLLHQRHYGGAFRQLLDATSQRRGDALESAVEKLFNDHEIQYLRTGGPNQEQIGKRFGLTVRPAPDFVVFEPGGALRAILECKAANDGGTARDKASRFRSLRAEGARLGGVPVFAVLAGLGWKRTGDALGPVVEATDGRVFTLATLPEMVTVEPLSALARGS